MTRNSLDDTTKVQNRSLSIWRSILQNKNSILWPIIAFFAAASFSIMAFAVIAFLIVSLAFKISSIPSIDDLVVTFSMAFLAFALILLSRFIQQAAIRVLWWRETAPHHPNQSSRPWYADLTRVILIDTFYGIFRSGLWTCQFFAWLGLLANSHPENCALYIALSATALLALAIVYRSCLAAQWCGCESESRGAIGFLSTLARGSAMLIQRPLEAIAYLLCPKLAFCTFTLCLFCALYTDAGMLWILLASLGMLVSLWIEPFLWFKRVGVSPS